MFDIAFTEVSNKETWSAGIALNDLETGARIDLSDAKITITVSARNSCQVLRASTEDGSISTAPVDPDESFHFTFTVEQMGTLCFATYNIGCLVERDSGTEQLFIGTVPIVRGL